MSKFDKIAKKATDNGSKKTTKIAAAVSDEVKNAVDIFIANKAEIKRLEAENGDKESVIIDHVRPQQDKLAYAGSFTKSLEVSGNNGSVVFSTSDRFSIPQDEAALAELKKIVGKKYDEMFESKQTIAIKPEVLKDEKTLDKIANACEKAGLAIGDLFDNTEKVIAKDDLDRKQYELTEEKLAEFRVIVRQNKPALK